MCITGVPQCVPIPWRTINLPEKMKLGILWDDGLTPSPAFSRTPPQSFRQALWDHLRHASGPCKLLHPFWRRTDTRSSPCLDILIFNIDTYLVWHSDPPNLLSGLRIGSQLMTNSCTTRAFPTRLPIDQRTFLSCSRIITSPLVRVQRHWRDERVIRTSPPPILDQALCLVSPPYPSRRGLRVAHRGLGREKHPGALCPRRSA